MVGRVLGATLSRRSGAAGLNCEALEDVIAAVAKDQENAGLDIIADGRVHGDNYADTAVYHICGAWATISRAAISAFRFTAVCTPGRSSAKFAGAAP